MNKRIMLFFGRKRENEESAPRAEKVNDPRNGKEGTHYRLRARGQKYRAVRAMGGFYEPRMQEFSEEANNYYPDDERAWQAAAKWMKNDGNIKTITIDKITIEPVGTMELVSPRPHIVRKEA